MGTLSWIWRRVLQKVSALACSFASFLLFGRDCLFSVLSDGLHFILSSGSVGA